MDINKKVLEDLEFISIRNKNYFEVTLCPLGASVYSIKKNDDYLSQTPIDITLFKQPNIYHGKTIGRVGNRIENGQFIINNKLYQLERNEGLNTLHSGLKGFSNQLFNYRIEINDNNTSVIFSYDVKDLEDGFPGNAHIEIRYTLYEGNDDLLLEFNAQSDQDTLMSLTNHLFFTLNSTNLDDLCLTIKADKYLHPRPSDLIILEERNIDEVMGFNKSKRIMKDINNPYLVNSKTFGYDHHYCFKEVNPNIPQIILENNQYKMEIYTDFSGNQIYTDNYPDDYKWFNSVGKKNRSIAIEPQDSLLNRKILKAGELYHRFIRYCFSRK